MGVPREGGTEAEFRNAIWILTPGMRLVSYLIPEVIPLESLALKQMSCHRVSWMLRVFNMVLSCFSLYMIMIDLTWQGGFQHIKKLIFYNHEESGMIVFCFVFETQKKKEYSFIINNPLGYYNDETFCNLISQIIS